MMYREVAPHPKLRKHIKCFWMLDHDYSDSFHDHERLWADAHTELIFTTGLPYCRRAAKRLIDLPAGFVIGPYQHQLELFSHGRTALVAARFWPWGFHVLSAVRMIDLKNTVQSCARTLGKPGESIERAVACVEKPSERIAALEQALLSAISVSERKKLLSRPIATDILESRGIIRVGQLLQKHDIPARRLERIFLEEIGVTAKVFSRIVRFNHAKAMIERNPDVDLLDLTYECGYADQPHFTRNFREMFGITPAGFKARLQEFFRRFQEKKPDVVFLQDMASPAD
jgi:AraC-like DNA-binding protein